MNPSPENVFKLLSVGMLGSVLKGSECVFTTPSHINNNLKPTDHVELLEKAIYPLAKHYGEKYIQEKLEESIKEISIDALGIFCAIQCYYMEILSEDAHASPLDIDRNELPIFLAQCFFKESEALHSLEIQENDLSIDMSYRITLSRMRILKRDHGIEWGAILPEPKQL
jgi:hypothetical protein